MDVSTSEEFIKVYEQISKLQEDITSVAKNCYDTSVVSYDEIEDAPENLSDFNNDLNFVTLDDLDNKIDSLEPIDDSNYLKKSGEDEQCCSIPTKFDSLTTKTQDKEDSSDSVATTEFVHNLVKSSDESTKQFVSGVFGTKKFVTHTELDDAVEESQQEIERTMDGKIEEKVDEAISGLDIPTKTSDLTNDSGFITIEDIPGDLVTSVNGQTGDVVIDIPTVPTNISAFNNDVGYITDPGVVSVNGRTGTVSVQENVQADWSATQGLAKILNKPDLSIYATISYVDDIVGDINSILEEVNGEMYD